MSKKSSKLIRLLQTVVMIVIWVLLLCGCESNDEQKKTEGESTWSGDSVAEHASDQTPAPEGMEIVTDHTKFQPVTEDQTYRFETDEQNCFADGGLISVAKDENSFYFLLDGYLHVFDIKAKQFTKLCNKPECNHNGAECNAYITEDGEYSQGLFYYQGDLYTIMAETGIQDPENKNNVYEAISVYRISTDGSRHKKVCELAKAFRTTDDEMRRAYSISCFQHRGYLYYCYVLQYSDDYYQNGSHVLWRIPLNGDGERECIMPFPKGCSTGLVRMLSAGSYVYFMVPDNIGEGELYRFNSEAKQVEKLDLPKLYFKDFALKDGKVLYKENTVKAILREYDPAAGEDRIWADLTDVQMKEAWGIDYDQGYTYVYHFNEESFENPDKRYMQIAPDGTMTKEISMKNIISQLQEEGVVGNGRGPYEGFFFYIVSDEEESVIYYLEINKAEGEAEFTRAEA